MAKLVSRRLARPAAIAVNLAAHFDRFGAIAFDKEIDCTFAAPALGVQPCVDHHTASAERERLQIAQTPNLEIVISAELVGQLLAVQCPTFAERVEGEDRADQGQAVGIFAFPYVAGNGLVIGQVSQIIFAVQVCAAQIDPEASGNGAILAASAAVGARCTGFFRDGNSGDLQIGIDQRVEGARHLALDPVDPVPDEFEDFLAPRIPLCKHIARVRTKRLHTLAYSAISITDLAQDGVHPRMKRFEFFQTLLVDFIGRHTCCGA